MKNFLDWMPVQAATWAQDVDFLNNFITYVAAFCTVAITGAMLWFAFKYRRRSENQRVEYITHNALLETVWTVVPTLVVIYVFWYGFVVYRDMRTPPANAMEVNVYASQWQWQFQYANGKKSPELYVPVGQPVRLLMKSISVDPNVPPVNHSLFIPAMRVKEDVIGGTFHHMWFQPTVLGDFPIYCAEYCGVSHYNMLSRLHVVSQGQFEDFLRDRGAQELSPVELGAKQYKEKGCNACHSLDGQRLVGPTFKGLWGRTTTLADDSTVLVDENYIVESIRDPHAKVVKGYPDVMIAQAMTDDEISALIAWLKTLE